MRVCEEFVPLLLRAVDRALTTGDRERLEVHLAECASCRAALTHQEDAKSLLTSLTWPTVSAGFSHEVVGYVSPAWYGLSSSSCRRWALRLASVAALLIGFALWMPRGGGRDVPISSLEWTWATGADALLDARVDPNALIIVALDEQR